MNTRIRRALCAILALAAAGGALGQAAYPAKPVRFIVPFPPGGGSDAVARMVGQELAKPLGQQVVIENRGGGGGTIGVAAGVKSPPDGYTIFLGSTGGMAINPVFMAKPPYDPIADVAPISTLCLSPLMLAVPASSPIHSVQDLIAAARANPGGLSFGSAGSGTAHHLAGEMFNQMNGIRITHVPYKGSGPAATDVVAGQVPVAIVDVTSIIAHVRSGRARGLATLGERRTAVAPDIVSMAEAGVPNFDAVGWFVLGAPAGTPGDVIARLNRETVRILSLAEIRERFIATGVEARSSTPEEMAAFVRDEVAKWSRVIRISGAKPE